MFRPRASFTLLAAVVLSGCVTQSVTVAGPPGNAPSNASTTGLPLPSAVAPLAPATVPGARATTIIAGRVTAPPGMVAAGGGNMVAAGGLNFGLLATSENPLTNAWVRLADSAGQVFPAIAAVQADAQGRFEIRGVPSDLTFIVQSAVTTAAGKAAKLQTIVRPGVLGATSELSAASTCVTAAVLEGQGNVLGEVDPARFKRAVDATRQGLAEKPWPDLADRGAVLATMSDLAKEVVELREALDAVREDLRKLQGDVAQIRKELDELKHHQAGAMPEPGTAGSPGPIMQPTASPTATSESQDGWYVQPDFRIPLPGVFKPADRKFPLHRAAELRGLFADSTDRNGAVYFGILAIDNVTSLGENVVTSLEPHFQVDDEAALEVIFATWAGNTRWTGGIEWGLRADTGLSLEWKYPVPGGEERLLLVRGARWGKKYYCWFQDAPAKRFATMPTAWGYLDESLRKFEFTGTEP